MNLLASNCTSQYVPCLLRQLALHYIVLLFITESTVLFPHSDKQTNRKADRQTDSNQWVGSVRSLGGGPAVDLRAFLCLQSLCEAGTGACQRESEEHAIDISCLGTNVWSTSSRQQQQQQCEHRWLQANLIAFNQANAIAALTGANRNRRIEAKGTTSRAKHCQTEQAVRRQK